MARVLHVYPRHGLVNVTATEHDLASPWEFNLPECDVCRGPDKCLQTTIVSKNYPDTLVVHGLTSCPIVQVHLPFPSHSAMGMLDIRTQLPRMEAEEVRKAFMEGFSGAILDDAGNLRRLP